MISINNPDGFELGFLQIHNVFVYYSIVSFEKEETKCADNFTLEQNYPNPFNPSTRIKFTIPFVETHRDASLHITLKVFDILGNEIATLINEEKPAGTYEVKFDAT